MHECNLPGPCVCMLSGHDHVMQPENPERKRDEMRATQIRIDKERLDELIGLVRARLSTARLRRRPKYRHVQPLPANLPANDTDVLLSSDVRATHLAGTYVFRTDREKGRWGGPYTVTIPTGINKVTGIPDRPDCTCTQYYFRKRNSRGDQPNMCKHIVRAYLMIGNGEINE